MAISEVSGVTGDIALIRAQLLAILLACMIYGTLELEPPKPYHSWSLTTVHIIGAYIPICVSHLILLWKRRCNNRYYYYHLRVTILLLITNSVVCFLPFAPSVRTPADVLWFLQALLDQARIRFSNSSYSPESTFVLHEYVLWKVCWVVTVSLADLFLVYRVYVVYDFLKRVVAIPLVLWLFSFAASIAFPFFYTSAMVDESKERDSRRTTAFLAELCTTLCLNVVCLGTRTPS